MKRRILNLMLGIVGSLYFMASGAYYCFVGATVGFFGGPYILGWIAAVLMILFGGYFLWSTIRFWRLGL